jgi:pimeloyl-ACP methyl ester carboxylesterase
MERAKVGEITLAYETSGAGEPVILIHGGLVADAFRPLLTEPELTSRYWLILYHRRGYGESGPVSDPVSVGSQVEDCAGLLQHLDVDKAHIVGHSYGGVVALQMALDHPAMVHSLALLEPALAVGKSGEEYRASLERGITHYRETDTEAEVLVDAFLRARWPEYRSRLDHVLPGAFDQAVADAGTAFDRELPGLLDWHFGEAEAQRIHQPTLSVLGDRSNDFSPRFAEVHQFLQSWLPRAEGFVLPDATHFLQVENPQDMASALADFWERHPL